MAEERKPRVLINRVYTRGGDKGQTSLASGERLAKDSLRIETYGAVDELNSRVGSAIICLNDRHRHMVN